MSAGRGSSETWAVRGCGASTATQLAQFTSRSWMATWCGSMRLKSIVGLVIYLFQSLKRLPSAGSPATPLLNAICASFISICRSVCFAIRASNRDTRITSPTLWTTTATAKAANCQVQALSCRSPVAPLGPWATTPLGPWPLAPSATRGLRHLTPCATTACAVESHRRFGITKYGFDSAELDRVGGIVNTVWLVERLHLSSQNINRLDAFRKTSP